MKKVFIYVAFIVVFISLIWDYNDYKETEQTIESALVDYP